MSELFEYEDNDKNQELTVNQFILKILLDVILSSNSGNNESFVLYDKKSEKITYVNKDVLSRLYQDNEEYIRTPYKESFDAIDNQEIALDDGTCQLKHETSIQKAQLVFNQNIFQNSDPQWIYETNSEKIHDDSEPEFTRIILMSKTEFQAYVRDNATVVVLNSNEASFILPGINDEYNKPLPVHTFQYVQ